MASSFFIFVAFLTQISYVCSRIKSTHSCELATINTYKEMTYDIEYIKQNWLLEGSIAYSEEQVLDAFNEVQKTLGQRYLDRIKLPKGNEIKGPSVTISAVELGLKLQVLKKGINYKSLISKLKSSIEVERTKAFAELDSIYFFCKDHDIEFELEPPVIRVGKPPSHPDFRIKKKNESEWIYVEVKQPDTSEENKAVLKTIQRMLNIFQSYNKLSVEIMLSGIPNEKELTEIEKKCLSIFPINQNVEFQIQNVGFVKISNQVNYIETPTQYSSFTDKPVLIGTQTLIGTEEDRTISCRIVVSDERTARILNDASGQLSSTASNIIWIDGRNVPSIKKWSNQIKKLFKEKPELNKKVSGLIIFIGGIELRDGIIRVKDNVDFMENKTAEFNLPVWIKEKLNDQ